MNRREFLSALAVSSLAVGLGERLFAAPSAASSNGLTFKGEASRLTASMMRQFWDDNSHMFRAPVLSAETVSSDAVHDRGYTLWASLLGLHALVEGEKRTPRVYNHRIGTLFDGLEQYYNPEIKAYTAWVHFEGNIDAYYDDNSWVVIILVEAAQACRRSSPKRARQYLERAKTVMAGFVTKGWDASDAPGGVRWGFDPNKPDTSDRGTSATAGAALAALVLARAGVEREFYTEWGHKVLNWLAAKLLDNDGLIMDALTPPEWKARGVKWTYNTGVPMRAYVEHFRLTQENASLEMATRLAKVSLDHNSALFDRKVTDPTQRQYWDGIYFVHYLVDGLLQVADATPDASLRNEIGAEVRRTAEYVETYLKDPSDGLYWRNFRLYTIDPARLDRWELLTGQKITPEYDATERSQEPRYASLPVEKRPTAKTLLANGGAARLLWLASDVPSDVPSSHVPSSDVPSTG